MVQPFLYLLFQIVALWRIRGREYREVFVLRGNSPAAGPFQPVQAFVGSDFAEPCFGMGAVKRGHVFVGGEKSVLGQILCVKIISCVFIADGEN